VAAADDGVVVVVAAAAAVVEFFESVSGFKRSKFLDFMALLWYSIHVHTTLLYPGWIRSHDS
jgi:hypothetical protein